MDVVRKLNAHVIGQTTAKVALAVAIHNHFAILQGDTHTADGVVVDKFNKQNTLVIGPTGCGKTFLLETLAKAVDVPFAIVDTTKLTESGYVGGKVEDALLTLWVRAGFDLEKAQKGIVYFDEFDKIAKVAQASSTRDVSGEGVQRGLLSMLGGAIIRLNVKGAGGPNAALETIEFDTTNVLFVCGGAFVGLERIIEARISGKTSIGFGATVVAREEDPKKLLGLLSKVTDEDLVAFGMIPELVGRLPNRTAVSALDVTELLRILKEPRNSLLDQYSALLRSSVKLTFSDDALMEIAKEAAASGTGARALQRIVGEVLRPTNMLLPAEKTITVDDVIKREDKLTEAMKIVVEGTAVGTNEEPAVEKAGPPLLNFNAEDGSSGKPVVLQSLEIPFNAWMVKLYGDLNGTSLRLMRDARTRSYWVLRRHKIAATCSSCQHVTELDVEWTVPFKKGVDPFTQIGEKSPLGWFCGAPECKKHNHGELTQKNPDWKIEV